MARQFFPDLDPLGQRIQLGTEPDPDFPTMEIVGVVGDVKQSFEAGAKAEMFVPYAQHPDPILAGMYLNTALVVRTAGDPAALTASVRAALREIDPDQPLVNVRTMETRDREHGGAAAAADDAAAALRRPRGRAGGGRRLRRDGLHRVAAHPGDRRAHGDRRVTRPGRGGWWSGRARS